MLALGPTRHNSIFDPRSLALASGLALILALGSTSSAAAQAWGVSTPVRVVDPSEPPPPVHTHHVTRDRLVIGGIAVLAAGYVAAAVWGGYYLGSLHLGPLSCNDQYGGWHFVPVVGPVVGMFAGGGCIPDGLHVEEAMMPAIFSVVQLTGLILVIVGVLGHDVPDEPAFSFSADSNGGYASVRWSL